MIDIPCTWLPRQISFNKFFMNELKQKRYKNYIKRNVVLIFNGYGDTFLSCSVSRTREPTPTKGEMRELFASSGKSLFYVITIQEHLKPSNEAAPLTGKEEQKRFWKWAIFDRKHIAHKHIQISSRTFIQKPLNARKTVEVGKVSNSLRKCLVSFSSSGIVAFKSERTGEWYLSVLFQYDGWRAASAHKFIASTRRWTLAVGAKERRKFDTVYKSLQKTTTVEPMKLLILLKTLFSHERTLNTVENIFYIQFWRRKK